MPDRLRQPVPTETRRPRAEPAPSDHPVLALQRRLGNQAVQRLLAAQ